MSDSILYCLKCLKRNRNSSQPCTVCGTALDVVEWDEPAEDCTKLDFRLADCIEQNLMVSEYCDSCVIWSLWEVARAA